MTVPPLRVLVIVAVPAAGVLRAGRPDPAGPEALAPVALAQEGDAPGTDALTTAVAMAVALAVAAAVLVAAPATHVKVPAAPGVDRVVGRAPRVVPRARRVVRAVREAGGPEMVEGRADVPATATARLVVARAPAVTRRGTTRGRR